MNRSFELLAERISQAVRGRETIYLCPQGPHKLTVDVKHEGWRVKAYYGSDTLQFQGARAGKTKANPLLLQFEDGKGQTVEVPNTKIEKVFGEDVTRLFNTILDDDFQDLLADAYRNLLIRNPLPVSKTQSQTPRPTNWGSW